VFVRCFKHIQIFQEKKNNQGLFVAKGGGKWVNLKGSTMAFEVL
jgi:hypothetical protein